MISIIVCSRYTQLLNDFKKNVTETIGTTYEIIAIDNSQNDTSIFEAYNQGVKKSSGNILCFAHEDILFYTSDWGLKLVQHFENDAKLGLIGTVGSTALPAAPAPWWNRHKENTHFINLLQKWKPNDNINRWKINESYGNTDLIYHKENHTGQIINQVTAVDGFFMAIPKSMFNYIKFDSKTFKGFHCYDLDICMQTNIANYKVAVIHNILIAHFSTGSINNEWIEASIIFVKKWRKYLPYRITPFAKEEEKLYTNNLLLSFCYWNYKKLPNSEIRRIISDFLQPSNFFTDSDFRTLFLWKYSNLFCVKLVNKFFRKRTAKK